MRLNDFKTFPDEYEFSGDFREQWRQIGNAVPVKMVEVVANAIMNQYFKK